MRPLELTEELPRVGAEGLDVAALALGVERVEGEARLARAADARERPRACAWEPRGDRLSRLCSREPKTSMKSGSRAAS